MNSSESPVAAMAMQLKMKRKSEKRRERRAAQAAMVADPLLDNAEGAAEAGLPLSTWFTKRPPPCVRLGPRSPRWRRSAIRAWLEKMK